MLSEKTDYQSYLSAVVHCMTDQLGLPLDDVEYHLEEDHQFIKDLFAEDPEVLFHDDPIRLAKSLGVRWEMIRNNIHSNECREEWYRRWKREYPIYPSHNGDVDLVTGKWIWKGWSNNA